MPDSNSRAFRDPSKRHAALKRSASARRRPLVLRRRCPMHPDWVAKKKSEAAQDPLVKYRQRQQAKQQMLMNGWCCHQVNHLAEIYPLNTFMYLATLTRSPQRQLDHARCVEYSSCIAFNTNLANYKTSHTSENCNCTSISTPYKQLKKVIRAGAIPLISIEGNSEHESYGLRVHKRSRKSVYVAISHVWADGLGNPNVCALPQCQISRLQVRLLALKELFKDLQTPVLFWMDTLCIPVGPDEQALRLMQIDKMASIYKGAITSLVLDAELMATRLDARSYSLAMTRTPKSDAGQKIALGRDMHARILCSAWMSRSWTLQEGELPETITIQFMNRAVALGKASAILRTYEERSTTEQRFGEASETQPEPDSSMLSTGQMIPLQRFADLAAESEDSPASSKCECVDNSLQNSLFSTFFEDHKSFTSVWNALAGRSTTMTQDVPLIVTNILGMENKDLIRCNEPRQMFQAILLGVGVVPLCFFFDTKMRTYQDGYHRRNSWIPTSIGDEILPNGKTLVFGPGHLLCAYKESYDHRHISIYILDGELPIASDIYLRSEAECMLLLSLETTSDEPAESSAEELTVSKTCIIVENAGSSGDPDVKRGAYFKIESDRDTKSLLSPTHEPLPSARTIEISFVRPIRLRQIKSGASAVPQGHHPFDLEQITTDCHLKIMFDILPGVKPLRRRPKAPFIRLIPLSGYFFAFTIGIAVAVALGVFTSCPGGVAFIVALFVGVSIWATNWLVVAPRWLELSAWWYIRSFEAIAKERRTGSRV